MNPTKRSILLNAIGILKDTPFKSKLRLVFSSSIRHHSTIMKLYIGADHRGFEVKEKLIPWLAEQGHDVVDCGNEKYDKDDDFPDFAFPVADNVADAACSTPGVEARGIVICGSGGGVTIAANKVPGIRCVLGMNAKDVEHNRAHDDANVLALAANFTDIEDMKKMITVFLKTSFSGEAKYKRRLRKIEVREEMCCGECEEEETPQHGHCDCC